MAYLHTSGGAIFLLQALTSAFFAILFLQSGSDKIIDRRGTWNGLRDTSRRVRSREWSVCCSASSR